jgi:MFS superfamily sulfate permease-like transporter
VIAKSSLRTSLQAHVSDAFAGILTAAIFYAEYLSLGAGISSALPGQSGAALGTNMVLGSVLLCCFCSLFTSKPLLAGPRAASIAVLIFGMKLAADQVALQEARLSTALIALLVIVLSASFTQLLGLNSKVQRIIASSPLALRKGFMYATATAITVGASFGLDGCLQIAPLTTLAIVTLSLAAAILWIYTCKQRYASGKLNKFTSLSMVIGVATATIAYYLFIADQTSRGQCGTLGMQGLELSNFTTLVVSKFSFNSAVSNLPLWMWPTLCFIGVLTGIVTLLESLSTLGESRYGITQSEWAKYIKINAAMNFFAAPLGFTCSSFSASRTAALLEAQGKSNKATLWHGVALLAILTSLTSVIGKIPQLAITVAILLVAIQMIDDAMATEVWGKGFTKSATSNDVQSTWGFLGTLCFSIAAGLIFRTTGIAFSAGAVLALVVGTCAIYLARSFKR